jgi:hypothetical protein
MVHAEGPVCSRLSFLFKIALRLIFCVILRPWQINLHRVQVKIISWRSLEVLRQRIPFLNLEFREHTLREILTRSKLIFHLIKWITEPVLECSKHLRMVMHYRLHTESRGMVML